MAEERCFAMIAPDLVGRNDPNRKLPYQHDGCTALTTELLRENIYTFHLASQQPHLFSHTLGSAYKGIEFKGISTTGPIL